MENSGLNFGGGGCQHFSFFLNYPRLKGGEGIIENFLVISPLIEYLSLARTEYEKRVRAQAKAMMDG